MVRAPPISVVIPGHLWPSWSYLVVLIILAHFGHSLSFWPWVIIRDVVIITLIRGYPWPFVVLLVLRGHAGHPWSSMVGPVIRGHSGHSGRFRHSCSFSSFMITPVILMILAHLGILYHEGLLSPSPFGFAVMRTFLQRLHHRKCPHSFVHDRFHVCVWVCLEVLSVREAQPHHGTP